MSEQVTVITGASKGIGLATARRLAEAGHRVIGLARTRPDGFPGEFISVDLASRAATAEALTMVAGWHQVTGLFNNVGLVRPAALGAIDLGDLDAVYDLTLRVSVQVTQALLPSMRAAGGGRIVNMTSLTVLGMPARTAYASAKAALLNMTRSWALELAGENITVNAVAPGPVETELFRENNPPGSPGEARYLSLVPMGRLGRPEEIAGAVAFLMGPDAGWMTGQCLYVDGGASVGRMSA